MSPFTQRVVTGVAELYPSPIAGRKTGSRRQSMLDVALVNMPFADARFPTIALTQLKSILASSHPRDVRCDLHYLNHDFAAFYG
ncbi:MAG: hypothetical protein MI919_16115, partial [Holophagales bacterium]|nr:hypothetical protein [Holophagales bacterium]